MRRMWLAVAAGILLLMPSVQGQSAALATAAPWWKHAVFYEIYPRSFQDSNGDGVGDLNGITSRLNYLQGLGVDAIWIAPCYPSPQVDFGYDVADYTAIDPQYGTLADFDRLVAEAKKRHIRVVMDMVLNHTSDKHKWFEESASSRTNRRQIGTSGTTASRHRSVRQTRLREPVSTTGRRGGSCRRTTGLPCSRDRLGSGMRSVVSSITTSFTSSNRT